MSNELKCTVGTKSWEGSVGRSQSVSRKRGPRLFRTMSVAHVDDDEILITEKSFSDGGIYTGKWGDQVAHGQGKYLWSDGCMYVGDWSKGKMTGKGKFSWPSGATYEGEFKNGYMDGKGTYTGSAGEMYRGTWRMNLRHGNGRKCYGNGDQYEGDWCRGVQEGSGRYRWKKGDCYIGQWKNGRMNGMGTMIWKNGNRYDGTWDAGYPQGNGTFRWADGSFYIGVWSLDPKEQSGTYYPAWNSDVASLDWNPQLVYSIDLSDCRICPGEKVSVLPSQKIPHWAGVDVWLSQKMSVHSSPTKENDERGGNGSWGSDHDSSDRTSTPVRKQGLTISKGHKNYELMLSLQLGIRYSVGRPASTSFLDLRASAFDPKEKVWTKFPPEGSKCTPPHQACEFKWKDYCPIVFRTLRRLFKVDPADYMLSICGNDALRELSSPGKSGSFFYLTNDDRYMIKTIKKPEVKVLLRMLPAYYNHVRAFENTLVTRFYGLHSVKLGPAQKKVRFVIMGNLFCSSIIIHRRFDLKGSTFGRTTNKPEEEIDATTTLKDLDLNYVFRLQKAWFHDFCRQLDRDCEFLEQERVMDYSLLVGVHFKETSTEARSPAGNRNINSRPPRFFRGNIDQLLSDPSRWASMRLGTNMPARVERTVRRTDEFQLIGEPTGELREVVLYFGVIDILQDYDISKKLEHAYKSFQYDPTSISAVDPRQYSKRFRDFIYRVFVEDTCV